MEEVFKTIVGFKNYEVSNMGNVRNIQFNRPVNQRINVRGYQSVRLSNLNTCTTKQIHRLVAEMFLDNETNKKYVDHIDNNKLNNYLNNLRFATDKENAQNKSMSKNNTSGTKGVYQIKSTKKWCAQITIDYIHINLGHFENKEDAIQARIIKANQAFGIYVHSSEKINEI